MFKSDKTILPCNHSHRVHHDRTNDDHQLNHDHNYDHNYHNCDHNYHSDSEFRCYKYTEEDYTSLMSYHDYQTNRVKVNLSE